MLNTPNALRGFGRIAYRIGYNPCDAIEYTERALGRILTNDQRAMVRAGWGDERCAVETPELIEEYRKAVG